MFGLGLGLGLTNHPKGLSTMEILRIRALVELIVATATSILRKDPGKMRYERESSKRVQLCSKDPTTTWSTPITKSGFHWLVDWPKKKLGWVGFPDDNYEGACHGAFWDSQWLGVTRWRGRGEGLGLGWDELRVGVKLEAVPECWHLSSGSQSQQRLFWV